MLHRIDKLCDRFEAACKVGPVPRIEECLSCAGGAIRSTTLARAVVVELHHFRDAGQQVQLQHYLDRFPEDTEIVDDVFRQAEVVAASFGTLPFGGQDIASAIVFIVALVFIYRSQLHPAGVLPLGTLLMYAMWQSFEGAFTPLWVVTLIVVLAVSGYAIWQAVNK